MGCVYVIGIEGSELVKIGSTRKDPRKRLRELQVGIPYKLKLLKVFPCDLHLVVESLIHDILRERQERGEWFDVSLDSIEDAFLESSSPVMQKSKKGMTAFSYGAIERLRRQCRFRKVTAGKLSSMTGLAYGTCYRLLSGAVQQPSFEVMAMVAQSLGLSLDYLAGFIPGR